MWGRGLNVKVPLSDFSLLPDLNVTSNVFRTPVFSPDKKANSTYAADIEARTTPPAPWWYPTQRVGVAS